MVCSWLHNMRFFSIRFELQVIRKGCITITTNTKPLAIEISLQGLVDDRKQTRELNSDLERNTC